MRSSVRITPGVVIGVGSPDRVVFDHVIAALVHSSGYERIATPGCSESTIGRRLDDWAEAGISEDLLRERLAGYEQMIGLDLDDMSVDGSITKSPGGARCPSAARLTRGKQGTKPSVADNGAGIPMGIVAAGANEHDSPLLEPTLAAIPELIGPLPKPPYQPRLHLDRGSDSATTRDILEILGHDAEIAAKAVPAPIQADKRWPIERTHSWKNGFGKLRHVTDKRNSVVHFYLCLAAANTLLRRLINRARTLYRWPTRPTTRQLR